jgi:hypothetical protein
MFRFALLLAISIGAQAQTIPNPPKAPAAHATLFKRAEYIPVANEGMMSLEQREKVAHYRPGRNGTKAMTFVRMNRDALRSKAITLEMPNGKNYTFTGGISKATTGPMTCWSGKISMAERAFICTSGGFIDGEIYVEGKQFHLVDNGDSQILRELETGAASAPQKTSAAEIEDVVAPDLAAVLAERAEPDLMRASNGTGQPTRTIKVLVVWTGTAPFQALGNPLNLDKIESNSLLYINRTNEKLANSLAPNIKLQLVRVLRMTDTKWDNLYAIDVVDDARVDETIKKARDSDNADIVLLICKCNTAYGGGELHGAAGSVGGGKDGSATVVAGPGDAFAAVAASSLSSTLMVVEHEIGHVLGARHAYSGVSGPDTYTTPLANAHGYSVNLQTLYPSGYFLNECARDIMVMQAGPALSCSNPLGGVRFPYYSNPSVIVPYPVGSGPTFPLGAVGAHADSVGAFLAWAPTVSLFAESARLALVQTPTTPNPTAPPDPAVPVPPAAPPTSPPAKPPVFGLKQFLQTVTGYRAIAYLLGF